ncbi:purine phosphorylase [Thiohalorhabdus methylotrophus]|uniref:Purine phosphorylase n=1 Tax=Thiohalorhabdus methylotrophus TaxID=3242694 RepID=A0ABV4TUV9_9GAMM
MPIGVVTGLPLEAGCLPSGLSGGAERTLVCRGGIGPERAERAARRLLDCGANALMSWGIAGGLDPSLPPGTLLVPKRLGNGVWLPVGGSWRDRLVEALRPRLRVSEGSLLHSDHTIASPAAKRDLYHAHGAGAVDQESSIVAAVARRAGVPFVALRAVADPGIRTLPQEAISALHADGTLRMEELLRGLLRRPAAATALPGLGMDVYRARKSLRVAGQALGSGFLAEEPGWQGSEAVSPALARFRIGH